MTTPDPQSVLASLGIDLDSVPEPDGDRWQAMLDTAFDPSTDAADPSVVPTMDDEQTYPDGDDVPAPSADDDSGPEHHDPSADHDPGGHPDPLDSHDDHGLTDHPDNDHHTEHPGDDPGHHDAGPWHG